MSGLGHIDLRVADVEVAVAPTAQVEGGDLLVVVGSAGRSEATEESA